MDTDAPPARASARPDRRVLVESTSLVSVMVFAALFGLVGALVAVPVTKAIQIVIDAWRSARAPPELPRAT
jgi:predicted PurR-regulated permease PerM